jgi:L-histidine N-alpha-methyltransferase
MAVIEKRLEITVHEKPEAGTGDGSDLVTALCQSTKVLPPGLIYDRRGRELFRQLRDVPEYYMPRTARAVLQRHVDEVPAITGPADIIETAADDIESTRWVLDAYRRPGRPQLYVPIVAEPTAAIETGPRLLRQYPDLTIHGLSGHGGSEVVALPPRLADSRIVVCLDNALGMLTAAASRAFLASVRGALRPDDWFLAGVDLATDPALLEAAYNDCSGLVAALNFNALHHINRRYDGRFDVEKFAHRAVYNAEKGRMEMSLLSRERQLVRIPGLGFEFELLEGAPILTEMSRKFTLSVIEAEFEAAGFAFVAVWADPKELYALFLFRAE